MQASQVCIDLFLLSSGTGAMDVATLSDLTMTTGGSLYPYFNFIPALDTDQILNDLKWNVSRVQGLEAVMRLRCSAGLEVDSYTGSFYRCGASLILVS